MTPIEAPSVAWLEERSVPEPNTGCVLWTGPLHSHGYGYFRYRGRNTLAHRAAYEAHLGPVPAGLFVCHRCDTPACINPAHLFAGTPADNVHDMIAKGRYRGGPLRLPTLEQRARGSRHGRAKLTEQDVVEIRRAANGGETQASLAVRFSVAASLISFICTRKIWKHVE